MIKFFDSEKQDLDVKVKARVIEECQKKGIRINEFISLSVEQ